MNKLKKYLVINALFSAISGTIMIFFRENFNLFFNLENNLVFTITGSGLLLFSVFVFYTSRKHSTNSKLVNTITFLDLLWVIGSIIISFFGLFNLSDRGYLTIMIIAIWIGFLALKQLKYNKSETNG